MNLKIKLFTKSAVLFFACTSTWNLYGQQAPLKLGSAEIISYNKDTKLPNAIKFSPDQNIKEGEFADWSAHAFNLPNTTVFRAYRTEKDDLGYTHTRYKEYINNFPVEGTMLITHSKNGRLNSVNGDYFLLFNSNQTASITEKSALESALKKVNAVKYKWENKEQEAAMRERLKQPDFTYFPKGELVMVHKSKSDYSAANLCLAYKFNIYAEKPLYRSYVYVDAATSEVIAEEQIIHTADIVGTANTKYSGNVTMTSDNYGAGQYRLRETGRGLGVETYNLNNSTSYTNTDFTNTSSAWNVSGIDQAASDAHWGAEKTYDYYQQVHSRSSIDGAGYALLSYVHYDVNFVNAFWDGQEMTYGDGNLSNGFEIMTALDVCGHEITHGLTSFTANLGSGEAGALNEGFSDIFGTSIEFFARPSQHDWLMGADIMTNHSGLRDMSNPANLGQPNCYLGTNWDPNGEVHNNDGPAIYWYYLLCQGGAGTNDIGSAYTVTGITMAKAEKIAFRGLTVYFTPGTNYADARTQTIQAAVDLYGGCSPEVIATTNAWYAVGVGPAFTGTVSPSFQANSTSSCVLPFLVGFTNTSTNGSNAVWYFGDGATSTLNNPSHTYGTAGVYNVKLIVSGACGTDSVVQTAYITVNPPVSPTGTGGSSCNTPAAITLSASGGGTLAWFSTATGGTQLNTGTTFTTPPINATTTYYVESQNPGATGHVGPPTTTAFGGGSYHYNNSFQYLSFDVLQPCTLQTALVNSAAAGIRNVLLWDNTGTQLQSIPINFPSGTGTVTFNLHLLPGSYRIGGDSMNLWRNNDSLGGGAYTFSLNGVVNITGSSAGRAFYYYFYNWQVENDPCISARTPVVATINGPVVTYVSSIDSICLNASPLILTGGSPAGGTYSGPGVSSGSFSPAAAGAGSQTITYSYTDINSCTKTASRNIFVSTGSGTASFTASATTSCVLPFAVSFTNTSTLGSNAVWHFGDGASSTLNNPTHSYLTTGNYTVTLVESGGCGTDSVVQTSFININSPTPPTVAGAVSCSAPAIVTLGAAGSGILSWYSAPTGGVSLNIGNTFTTPSLNTSTTYYVENQNPGPTGHVGPATTTAFGGGGYHNNSSVQYEAFDVLQPCTLQTALVNSGAAGIRNILLWDNTGILLQTIPINFPNGTGTVTINLHLNSGSYRIGGTAMNLWRNNDSLGGGAYTFSLGGVINITGSSAGRGFYYYLYDWVVQNDPCVSSRTPVIAAIGGPAVNYAATHDSVCITDSPALLTGGTPAGGTYTGAGVSAGLFSPSTAGAGSDLITYSFTDINSCTKTASQNIFVKSPCTDGINSIDAASGMTLYPNPANGSFTLEVSLLRDEKVRVELTNAIGEIIITENYNLVSGINKLPFDLNGNAKGIYFIQLRTAANVLTQRILMN